MDATLAVAFVAVAAVVVDKNAWHRVIETARGNQTNIHVEGEGRCSDVKICGREVADVTTVPFRLSTKTEVYLQSRFIHRFEPVLHNYGRRFYKTNYNRTVLCAASEAMSVRPLRVRVRSPGMQVRLVIPVWSEKNDYQLIGRGLKTIHLAVLNAFDRL